MKTKIYVTPIAWQGDKVLTYQVTDHSTGTKTITSETVKAMREWVADCAWPDLEPDEVDELSDTEVIRGVAHHFDGGIPEFLQSL